MPNGQTNTFERGWGRERRGDVVLLIVVISIVWGAGCAAVFGYRWAKQRGGDAGL